MISPGGDPQRLWGQPARRGQRGVQKRLGKGDPACSRCRTEAGGPCSRWGTVAFGIRDSLPAHGRWLQPPAGPPMATCGQRLPWESGSGRWAAACPLASGETHRNYLETCSAEFILTQGRSSGRSDLCLLQWFPKTTLGNPSLASVTLKT